MSAKPRKTKAEQREATIHALLTVAQQTFASVGYAAASTEEIVAQADVTRGALYHHFGSKQGLFEAVLRAVQTDVANRIAAAAAQPDAWDQLVAGCYAFLAASTDPAIQQIMLIDGPAVLGYQAWRQLDAETSGQLLEEVLAELRDANIIQPLPVTALHHLLSGAMNEAALWIAQAPNPHSALQEANVALGALLAALRQSPT